MLDWDLNDAEKLPCRDHEEEHFRKRVQLINDQSLGISLACLRNYEKVTVATREGIRGENCVLSQRWVSVSSVQFSHSVVSDSLWPHESQHTRPPCPSQTPGVYSNSCPSSRWCHPANSSSVVPFSSCPQSLQASGSFPMSQLFAWGGQ